MTPATRSTLLRWALFRNTYYFWAGTYIGGHVNNGCIINGPAWVSVVSGQGWGLLPIWVGYQAPSTNCSGAGGINGTTQQGSADADATISELSSLGYPAASTVALDIEPFTASDYCFSVVDPYVSGWVGEIRARGYHPVYYALYTDLYGYAQNIGSLNSPDDIWDACWSDCGSSTGNTVWSQAPIPDSYWTFDQRHHQYVGPHYELYSGTGEVCLDRDASIGQVTFGTSGWSNEGSCESDETSSQPSLDVEPTDQYFNNVGSCT